MSQRVKKYLPVLKRIRKMADTAKRAYVKKCDKEFIDCVSECAKNVIKGNVPLSPRQKARLRRDRNDLRSLAIKKTSLKKASNFAEGRISVYLATSGTDGARQSASKIMQAAKKLILVDEFDREYKRLQKPADVVAKTNSSLLLSNTLRNQSLSDDQKVREYIAALGAYIST